MRLDGGKEILIRCISMIGEGYRRGRGECGGSLISERLARLTTAGVGPAWATPKQLAPADPPQNAA